MKKLLGPLMVILSVSCFASDYSVKKSDDTTFRDYQKQVNKLNKNYHKRLHAIKQDYAKQASHEFNLLIANSLEKSILKLPKKATIQVTLKNHKIIVGRFDGYSKYDSSLWITPRGKTGLFRSEAYDVMEILDVRLVVIRDI